MSAAGRRKGARASALAGPPPSTALFTPAKRTRSFEDVVTQVRDAVLAGQIKHGERLPNERDLSRLFSVSRSTLREGLRVLEALGVIEIRRGASGGIFACEPGEDQVGSALEALIRFRGATAQDLAEFRTSFEGETAHWAAQRAQAEDNERLAAIAHQFSELAARENLPWPILAELDIRFHEAIARASKNQVRVAIMLGIHRALYLASSSIEPLMTLEVQRSIGRELGGIAAAVRERNARVARARMRRHVKRFSELERAIQESADGRGDSREAR